MSDILPLQEAIALRTVPVQGKRGGVTVTPDWCAAVAIVDRIRTRFRRSADWPTLTHGEQLVHTLICDLDGEVKNGGLHQYLTNSSGDRAEDVKGYLSELGATELRSMFDEISTLFPDRVISRDRVEREAVLWPRDEPTKLAIMDQVEVIERRYVGYWNDLWLRVMDYVEAHQAEFSLPA